MKYRSNRITELFKPIEVTITVESEEEIPALTEMSEKNVSIPDLLSIKNKDIAVNFLSNLRKSIKI